MKGGNVEEWKLGWCSVLDSLKSGEGGSELRHRVAFVLPFE